MSPLDAISLPTPLEPTTLSNLTATRESDFEALREALDNMHKSVTQASRAARAQGRKHARTTGMSMAQYDIGDYVLYADVWAHTRAKLRVKWCGPAQVTKAVSAWIFAVKNLLTGDEREVHASRLKFYSDVTLNVTEELLHQIAHNSEGHVVAQILDSRYSDAAKRFELLVNWRGLSSAEDSWEPAVTLLEDAVSGAYPWGNLIDAGVTYQVKEGKLPRQPTAFSSVQWELIKRMCRFKPEERLELDFVVKVLGYFAKRDPYTGDVNVQAALAKWHYEAKKVRRVWNSLKSSSSNQTGRSP
ncbi:hypothetical protein PF003_g36780 [Phytophthora fragariae]|nr:hypothetical protein PF003_g36780 [Phytophthora fragariae]